MKRPPTPQQFPAGKSKRNERPERRPPPRIEEEAVFGHRAGLAVLNGRPESVVRILHSPDLREEIDEALAKHPAARSIERIETEDERIARFASSTHHEGLCVITTPRRFVSIAELGDALLAKKGVALALDRVRNPYNIGSILRSAAFFGIDAALMGAPAPHPALPPDAVRVAEGGAEHMLLSRTTDLADTLGRLRSRGIKVYAAESGVTENAFTFAFPRPLVIVVGHEREGVGERVLAQCDGLVGIPGTGNVGSLNVGVAASVLIAQVTRR